MKAFLPRKVVNGREEERLRRNLLSLSIQATRDPHQHLQFTAEEANLNELKKPVNTKPVWEMLCNI